MTPAHSVKATRSASISPSCLDDSYRRIAFASRHEETLLERPVFRVEQPLSNARRIRFDTADLKEAKALLNEVTEQPVAAEGE